MRAAVYDQYGPPEVVRIEDVAEPAVGERDVLIEVHASTVSSGDWRMRSAEVPDGFKLVAPLIFGRRPKKRILGTEVAGVVRSVGDEVSRWRVGDRVFGFPGSAMGGHAELIAMPENGRVAAMPDNLEFGEAAALCFGGSTALSFIEEGGGIRAGERVLVVGATGTVGSAMVQLAKHFGAEVTAVCSTANVECARSLGADRVIDYQRDDFATANERYDVIMDTTATAPVARCKPLLRRKGRVLVVNGSFGDMLRAPFSLGAKVVAGPAKEDPAHLPVLAELASTESFRPLIDSTYPLERIVEAHRRVDTGHKRGSVVIEIR